MCVCVCVCVHAKASLDAQHSPNCTHISEQQYGHLCWCSQGNENSICNSTCYGLPWHDHGIPAALKAIYLVTWLYFKINVLLRTEACIELLLHTSQLWSCSASCMNGNYRLAVAQVGVAQKQDGGSNECISIYTRYHCQVTNACI